MKHTYLIIPLGILTLAISGDVDNANIDQNGEKNSGAYSHHTINQIIQFQNYQALDTQIIKTPVYQQNANEIKDSGIIIILVPDNESAAFVITSRGINKICRNFITSLLSNKVMQSSQKNTMVKRDATASRYKIFTGDYPSKHEFADIENSRPIYLF